MKIKIKETLSKVTSHWLFFPVLLLAIMFIAYELYLPEMGFYWDDWESLYFAKNPQSGYLWQFFKRDRPFSGFYYWILFRLIGTHFLRWQILTFLVRYGAFLALYYALIKVWNNHRQWLQYYVFLLAVFPGFTQSPMTLAYFRVYTSFLFFALSLLFTVKALSSQKHSFLFHTSAIIFSILQCLLVEYFVPLEMVRFLLIYFMLDQKEKPSFKDNLFRLIKIAIPYVLVIVSYGLYRFVFFSSLFHVENNNEAVILNEIFSGRLSAIIDFVQIMLQDILSILFTSYSGLVSPEFIQAKTYVYVSLLAGGILTAILYFTSKKPTSMEKKPQTQILLTGITALVFGGLPIWIMGRQTFVGLWSDRFVLAPMVGSVLLTVFFFIWIGKSSKQSLLILALLIGFSVSFQIRNTKLYQQNWEEQRSFYWQLHWRIPSMEEGTLMLSPSMPLSHVSTYSIGIALNHLYDSGEFSEQPEYWYINTSNYFDVETAALISQEMQVSTGVRTVRYDGELSQVIGFANNTKAGRCLRILDEPYNRFGSFSDFDAVEKNLYTLSDPQQWIITGQTQTPPQDIFGEEPEWNWCYYFQKQDLARQQEDWDAVITLYQQALQSGLQSNFLWEYVPILTAYGMQENWSSFEEVAVQIQHLSTDQDFDGFLDYIEETTPSSTQKTESLSLVREKFADR